MKNATHVLLLAWNQLNKVQRLTCNIQSKELIYMGEALVSVAKSGSNVLIFHEKGNWLGSQKMNFTNVFRWTLDRNADVISLEHLRYGSNFPVFLVNLAPSADRLLTSVRSHVCKSDIYTAKMSFDPYRIHLHWHVVGPKKNEEVNSYYF